MAKDHGPTVNDDRIYEALRRDGASKEKAARIANAAFAGDNPSSKGGKAKDLPDRTVSELRDRARELDIEGRSKMNKAELVDALRTN